MDFRQIMRALWRWGWLIALATVLGGACSYWATSRMPRQYDTVTTLMVGRLTRTANPTWQDLQISQDLARSYVQLVKRRGILEATIDSLGLDVTWETLARRVSATPVAGTQLIEIRATDTEPRRAKQIADEIARQLILQSPTPSEKEQQERAQFVNEQLRDLEQSIEVTKQEIESLKRDLQAETTATGIKDLQDRMAVSQQKITIWRSDYTNLLDFFQGSRTNYLSILEAASVPEKPARPNTWLNVLLSCLLALLLSAGAAFLLSYFEDTLETTDDVERTLALPTLGTIHRIGPFQQPTDILPTVRDPFSPIAEAYRMARTNIQFSTLAAKPSSFLLITSAVPAEGKTTTACNLAVVMAQAGKQVILVDADLRHPSVHRFFGISNRGGLTALLLRDRLSIESALVETEVNGLRILPSGPPPPNRLELLGSAAMLERLEQLRGLADYVLFDSPPVLAVADTSALASLCQGAVLVADSQRTRSDVVRRGKQALEQVGLRVFGVVLNKVSSRRMAGYSYAYGYPRVDEPEAEQTEVAEPQRVARP
jgi:non-specific protein-tyrosine kinase